MPDDVHTSMEWLQQYVESEHYLMARVAQNDTSCLALAGHAQFPSLSPGKCSHPSRDVPGVGDLVLLTLVSSLMPEQHLCYNVRLDSSDTRCLNW